MQWLEGDLGRRCEWEVIHMDSSRLKLRRVCSLLAMMISSIVSVTGASAELATQTEVDKPFPNIALPSMENGSPISIEQFRGKKIILHVFASW